MGDFRKYDDFYVAVHKCNWFSDFYIFSVPKASMNLFSMGLGFVLFVFLEIKGTLSFITHI